ncbi:ras guanine nucleotide exchange factor domain-containing protein [Cunninghamella echinulata]|nr:ras guanine nucleotide exchange factor domain-containing protein [Cunninghamella echinulata]
MLLASGTLDKDSMHLRTNAILRAHHRTMMAALSKLILSSESYNQNTTEYVNKILSDSNELLLATRNFISTAESIPIQVQHMEPTLQDRTLDNPNITAFRKASRNKFSLDEDLAENIEVYGTNMKDAVDGIVKSINTFQQQPSTTNLELTRSNFSATLFSQFRNFSSQTGQFLDIFEDIDYRKLQSPELIELNMTRQKLYDSLGEVFCKMQILTMDNTSLLEGITKDLNQDGIEIKKIIDSICHCVDKLAFDPNIKQQNMDKKSMARRSSDAMFASSGGNVNNNGNAGSGSKRVRASLASTNLTSSSIIEENDEEDMDNESYYTDVRSSSSHGGESAPFSTFDDFPSPTEPTIREEEGLNNNDNNNEDKTTNNDNNSQHRKTSTSSDFPRQSTAKLKKFFGDDVPESIPATTSTVDQTTTVIGGPPSVGVSSTAGNVTDNERPWYLQYDYKPNEIVFNMEGSVKGGTLDALVVRLTLHDYLDMNFINTFLLTYRSFCSSMQLLKLLEERYNTKPPEGLNEQELDIWMNKKLKLIRLRVFNVLKNWFEQYYNEDDTVILDELDRFTKATIHSTLPFSAEQLERLIKKRRESNCDGLKKMVLTQPTILPQPIIPRNRKKFKLLDVDTMELARQLTIMDFKLYSSIRPVECLNKAWSKDAEDDHAQVAVNIRASIEYCNQVTSWVSDAILSQLEVKKRVALIKYWVQVAERCRHLNNFNTCMAILSAFDNSAVGRLKRTWEMVGARTNHVLSQIRKLMGANKNFTEYRAIIHSINPPCIPFLGIYLQDLTFIEDGNADYLKTSKDMINFAKRAKTAEVIREIQQYQSTYYHLTVVDEIQAFIQNNLQSIRDEEQLYNESLKLEPREREDEKITRLLQESGFL